MKNCIKCTSPLNDEARFCPICGMEQEVDVIIRHNFCSSCGLSISHDTLFCPGCGKAIQSTQTMQMFKKVTPPLITSLANRIILSAVMWSVIGGFQILCGLLLFYMAAAASDWNSDYIVALLIYFVIGGLNLREVSRLLKSKKKILSDYKGIVWENRICFATCMNYTWNAYVIISGLIWGNEIGFVFAFVLIIAVMVDFAVVQLFVLRNKDSFLQLEKAQM